MAITGSVAARKMVGFLTAPDAGIAPLIAQLAYMQAFHWRRFRRHISSIRTFRMLWLRKLSP